MAKKQKKSRRGLFLALYFLGCAALGVLIGLFLGEHVENIAQSFGPPLFPFYTTVMFLLCLLIAFFLHVIVHEAGHLVFGLLTGYSFVSYRIGGLILIREGGRIRLRRFSLPGTLGQCLMLPPEREDGRYPYLLYNLGGSLFNLLLALPGLALFLLLPSIPLLTPMLALIGFYGIFMALSNAIPIKTRMISNDGANCVAIGRDEATRRSFFLQLKVNALLTQGKRLRELPEEWFFLPEDADLKNTSLCGTAYLQLCRLHDLRAFGEARALTEHLLENAPGMNGLHKNELRCELLFYELIGDRRPETLEELDTKELKQYIRATGGFPSRRRLLYARALLLDNDPTEAAKQLQAFEKAAGSYPYSGELQAERELLKLVRERSLSSDGTVQP